MLYRTRATLTTGQAAGSLLAETDLAPGAVAALRRRGVLVPVSPPPLRALPGWQHRGRRLAELGVTDAGQVIEGEVEGMARHLGVGPALVRRWQEELRGWLNPPAERPQG